MTMTWQLANARRYTGQLSWSELPVPLLRMEDRLPRPLGLSVIGIGTVR